MSAPRWELRAVADTPDGTVSWSADECPPDNLRRDYFGVYVASDEPGKAMHLVDLHPDTHAMTAMMLVAAHNAIVSD